MPDAFRIGQTVGWLGVEAEECSAMLCEHLATGIGKPQGYDDIPVHSIGCRIRLEHGCGRGTRGGR